MTNKQFIGMFKILLFIIHYLSNRFRSMMQLNYYFQTDMIIQ